MPSCRLEEAVGIEEVWFCFGAGRGKGGWWRSMIFLGEIWF